MARTQDNAIESIQDGTIQRSKVDVTTAGQALITKVLVTASSGLRVDASTGVDSGTGDVSLGSPLADAWNAYTPTVTFTGGAGATVSSSQCAWLLVGKLLLLRIRLTITYTTAPTGLKFNLPPSQKAVTSQTAWIANETTGALFAANISNAASPSNYFTPTYPLTASGQTIGYSGIIQAA